MTPLDLFTLIPIVAIAVVALHQRGRRVARDGDWTFSVDILEGGELTLRVGGKSTISAVEWWGLRDAARRWAEGLGRHAPSAQKTLAVNALGPLVIRRGGVAITGWGGPKAGSRQALAILAFLLDRGELGAHRNEIVELVWPEVDIGNADAAFHRTMGGLRGVLAGNDRALRRTVISARDSVYRLDHNLIGWSDVAEFEEHLLAIAGAEHLAVMETHLLAARRLYRGDYMDDCPIYGDSSQVEIRRHLLRDRYVSSMRIVAEQREVAGSVARAGQLYREALVIGGTGMEDAHPAASLHSVA